MVHYSCDACRRPIHPHNDVHHVVKIEVFPAATDPCSPTTQAEADHDRDHLEAMQSLLEQVAEADGADDDDGGRQAFRFDLCDACRERFLRNPLGLAVGKQLDFSAN